MYHKIAKDILYCEPREWHDKDLDYWMTLGITWDNLMQDKAFPVLKFGNTFKDNPYLRFHREYEHCYGWKFDENYFFYMPHQKPQAVSNIDSNVHQWFKGYPKKHDELWIADNYIDARILLNSGRDVRGIMYPNSYKFDFLEEYKKHWDTINFFVTGKKDKVSKILQTNYVSGINYYSLNDFYLTMRMINLKDVMLSMGNDATLEAIDNLAILVTQ